MSSTATVVIAPDSFKGTLPATAVARALAEGWASARPADRILLKPMADGGEGTLDAFAVAVPDAERREVRVVGPAGDTVDAEWLLLPDGTAVVELAATSGLGLMAQLAPLDAHTTGFGQAIADALHHGATGLLLAIGGSASTDGGTGALTALGARFLDGRGESIRPGARGLAALDRVDLTHLQGLPPGGARILSDVTNPLLGPTGAAAVFGPQKGATSADVALMDAGLARLAAVLGPSPTTPGSGAAGGTGYGLLSWGAVIEPGADAVGRALGMPAIVAGADVVVTGEGRYDSQSSAGKLPTYVAGLANAAGVPALLVAGAIAAEPTRFADAIALSELAGGTEAAIAEANRWVRAAGAELARRFAASSRGA